MTKKHSLFSELVLLMTIIIALSSLTIGWFTMSTVTNLAKKEQLKSLRHITEEKITTINQYIDRHLRHASMLSQAPTTQQAMVRLEKIFHHQGIHSTAYAKTSLQHHLFFENFLGSENYYDIFLIDPQGHIIYTIKHEADLTTNLYTGPYQHTALATVFKQAKDLLHTNNSTFEYYPPSQEAAAFVASPIIHEGKLLGVLAMQFDTHDFYKTINHLSGLGETGEVVTGIQQKGKVLITSPLRHDADAAFKRTIAFHAAHAQPIKESAQGQTGSGIIIDWRGEEVLAVWRYLPALQWGVVVKIDTQEALGVWAHAQQTLIGFVAIALFLSYLLTYMFAQRLTRPLKELAQQASSFAQGNESIVFDRNAYRQREVSILSQTFHQMLNRLLKSKLSLQHMVTELKTQNSLLDQRVAEQTVRIQAVIATASDAIITINQQGIIQTVNPAACSIFNYTEQELLGSPFNPLILGHCQDQQTHILQHRAEVDPHVIHLPCEGQGVRKSGESFAIEVSTNPMPISGQSLFLVMARDISKEKYRREQLEHAQRLESLGVLAGGIAHDFNNLLTAILGNAALARTRLDKASPAQPLIANIENASERAAALCKQMLAYSGKGKFIIENINLSVMVEEMVTLLEVSIQKSVFMRLDLAENLPPIEADASQMQQIMMNLVINASEAIEKRSGIITIHTGVTHINDAYIKTTYLNDSIAPGRYVTLEVSDTGCGMDHETKKHLFDPFFTTKFTGRGLGMSAILGIVRGHHGAIKVYSEIGKGSSFKLLFPCALAVETIAPIQVATPIVTKQQHTVLIIDDEETIREIASMMLESVGYTILTACDGIEGLKVFQQHQQHISIILLDMTMPRMNGEEVFRELKILQPDIKVLLSSGYNEQDATNHFVGKGLAGFLQKPYSPTALQNKVADILGSDICDT